MYIIGRKTGYGVYPTFLYYGDLYEHHNISFPQIHSSFPQAYFGIPNYSSISVVET
jgi:hypothetical protein